MPRPIHILGYVLVIALAAQLTIDLDLPNVTIPVSGQTLAILAGAVFLKPLESFVAIVAYCLLGIIGIPVFSDGGAGWNAFSGGSFGYFIGFVVGAIFVSYMAEKGKAESLLQLFLITVIGTFIILSIGTANLALEHGVEKGIEYGFTPFVLGGIVKILLGVGLVKLIRKLDLLSLKNM